MPDAGEVRWFRYGGARWALALTFASLGVLLVLRFIIDGIADPGGAGLVIVGAVLLPVCLAGAGGMLRAGIGVAPDQVFIRSGMGTTQAVPWSKIAGFQVRVNARRPTGLIDVVGTDGQRWSTFGCVAEGLSRRDTLIARRQLVRVLEDERLKHSPGAVAATSVSGRPPALPLWSPWRHWAPRVLVWVALLGVMVGAAVIGSSALTNLGPAFRAADGEGTVGYFIPQSGGCGKGCQWYGEFRLPSGTVTRRGTGLNDGGTNVQIGVPVPARDTGDSDGVFPASDPGAWGGPMSQLVTGYAMAVLLAAVGIAQPFRRRTLRRLFGDTSLALLDDHRVSPAVPEAAVALVQEREWRFSPSVTGDQKQHRSTPQTGRWLGRLDGALDGRPVTVSFYERVTSVGIVLPAGAIPKIRITVDPDSGQFIYKENATLGQQLMTQPAQVAVGRAGFASVTFTKNVLAGAFPRALTAPDIIEALRGLEKLLAAMPGDVLGAHGILMSDGVEDAPSS